MVEHSAVNRVVVGSSPTRGGWDWFSWIILSTKIPSPAVMGPCHKVPSASLPPYDIGRARDAKFAKENVVGPPICIGSMVKRLRHRPFTAVTRVQIPLESLLFGPLAQLVRATGS